jgi:hypothetical protein
MQDIEELCHRVLIIDHGKIFFDGPLTEIIDRFSGYKLVSLTFEKEAARDFSAFGEVIEQTPVSIQWKVPRAKVTETCRQLLEAVVSDINVRKCPSRSDPQRLFGERADKAARNRRSKLTSLANFFPSRPRIWISRCPTKVRSFHSRLLLLARWHFPTTEVEIQFSPPASVTPLPNG